MQYGVLVQYTGAKLYIGLPIVKIVFESFLINWDNKLFVVQILHTFGAQKNNN